MKTKVASLLAVVLLTTTQCIAQNRVIVKAESNDISNNLDLQAVASLFGDAKDLQEFEMKLNDYDSKISNLDLNNDGEVDYLRVIETSEKGVHLVLIQSVLERDVFQDVASIVVEKNQSNRTYVQIIGNPYIYGNNYIIEPVYVYTPSIFSFFWGNSYRQWTSPYYWGYYPKYYRAHNPYNVDIYLGHIHGFINHHHHYYYTERPRYHEYDRVYRSIGRNDYGTRYPERNFSSRNEHARNKYDIQVNRRSSNNSGYQYGTRSSESTRRSDNVRTEMDHNERRTYDQGSRSSGTERTSTVTRSNQGTRSQGAESTRTSDMNTGSRSSGSVTRESSPRQTPVVSQPSRSTETRSSETRSSSPVTRESSPRQTPVVSQPSRSSESRSTETRSSEGSRQSETQSRGGSRSESGSGRR